MAVTMYNSYDPNILQVKPAAPSGSISGLVSVSDGKASAQRHFLVRSKYANEFCLRMIGKYYEEGLYEVPWLPAEFPRGIGETGAWHYWMVATGFSMKPFDEACFNMLWTPEGEEDEIGIMDDPEALAQLEKYWRNVDPEETGGCDCNMIVTVTYEEVPWDCTYETNPSLMEHTGITIETNASYENYTLPRRNLVWEGITGPDRQLKSESYATIIIPKSDVIVTWHNIPITYLCALEDRLAGFRGKVNNAVWNDLNCGNEKGFPGSASTENLCEGFYPETLLFIDWDEDFSSRTRSFGPMDTTSIRLFFKEKSVPVAGLGDPVTGDTAGWNHLIMDRSQSPGVTHWNRVKIDPTGSSETDLFPPVSFTGMLGDLST
jgi:hypothetical protein